MGFEFLSKPVDALDVGGVAAGKFDDSQLRQTLAEDVNDPLVPDSLSYKFQVYLIGFAASGLRYSSGTSLPRYRISRRARFCHTHPS
jgi:hypothetical protein